MATALKPVSPRKIEKGMIHRCDVYHLEKASGSILGVPQESDYDYPTTPSQTEVPCFFKLIDYKLPDTDDSHPNRILYEVYSVIFMQDYDIRLNDKVIYDGQEFQLNKPQKIHTVAWKVLAIRQKSV